MVYFVTARRYFITTQKMMLIFVFLLGIVQSKVSLDGCGENKTCLFYPSNCDQTGDCDRFLSYYYEDGEDAIHFEVAAKPKEAGQDFYAAVGFSIDNEMGEDAVTICAYPNGGTVKMLLGYNPMGRSPTVMVPENYVQSVIANSSGSLVDGMLHCVFSQKVQVAPDVSATEHGIFSLDSNYYLLMASGPYNVSGDNIGRHFSTPLITDSSVYMLTSPTNVKLISKNGCGYAKGCLVSPAGCDPSYNCDRSVTYVIMNESESVRFEISAKRPQNTSGDFYAAAGFSVNGAMGNASVTACTMSGSKFDVSLWHNPAGHRPSEAVNPSENLTTVINLEEAGLVNDILVCRYTQKIRAPAAYNDKIWPLNEPHHLLLARGNYNTQQQRLSIHKEIPLISKDPIDVTGPFNKQTSPISKVECGQWKGCLAQSDWCSPSDPCRQLTYALSNDGAWITFEMSSRIPRGPQHYAEVAMYAVIGFSNDTKMADTAFTACSYSGSAGGKVEFGYIPPQYSKSRTLPVMLNVSNIDNYLKLLEVGMVDDVFVCRLQQRVDPPPLPNGQVVSLRDEHYIFVARGPYVEGYTHRHTDSPVVSSTKLNVTDVMGRSVTTPSTPTGCGNGTGCVRSPPSCTPGATCDYSLTYAVDSTTPSFVSMELSMRLAQSHDVPYIALGFSKDKSMGDDAVTLCYYNKNGNGSIGLFHNPGGHSASESAGVDSTRMISMEGSSLVNNILTCKFKQKIDPPTGSSTVFNLNKAYYLFFASGGFSGTVPSMHDTTPSVTDQQINVTSVQVYDTRTASDYTMILKKTHGILMILGWWVFIVNGVLLARYFKKSLKLWFVLHRSVNSLGLLCIVVAFICIFVARQGVWAGNDPGSAGVHSILGMTAVVSGLFNPLMAFFRCHPGTAKRPIFNWAHRTVGILSWCSASAAIFEISKEPFQYNLTETGAFNSVPRILMYVYFVTLGFIILVLEEFHVSFDEKGQGPLFSNTTTPNGTLPNGSVSAKNPMQKIGYFKMATLLIFDLVGVSVAVMEAAFVGLSGN